MDRALTRGLTQVVWVEHMEVVGEEKPLQPVFKDHVAGGAAFGATRWVSVLQRQCERLASELARSIADQGGKNHPAPRRSHRTPCLLYAAYISPD